MELKKQFRLAQAMTEKLDGYASRTFFGQQQLS